MTLGETTSLDAIAHIPGRMGMYPKISEQLDALWHDIDNGTLDKNGEFYNMLKTVKDSYPKSSS
jgi:hypothetical protein